MNANDSLYPNDIDAILFDLGNVLIDIDFYRCARLWSDRSGVPAETLVARFRIDDAYRDFECGRIDAPDYYEDLRRQLGIDLPDDIMRAGWNTIILGEKPGIRDCLDRLRHRYPLYVLTNTNPEHEVVWADKHRELLFYFEAVFVSSRMGCRKPDAEIFRRAARSMGVPCSRILFFDDAEENVLGARQCGMQAIRADAAGAIALSIAPLVAGPNG